MKRIMILFLSFVFIVSSVKVSHAVSETEEKTDYTVEKTVITNEWDEYKKLVAKTNKELAECGYSEKQIAEIRNFDYSDEVRKRAKMDNNTLRRYGYTELEIIKLRDVAKMDIIPESTLKAISNSTMTTKLKYRSSGSKLEGTPRKPMYFVNFRFSWKWNRIPFFTLLDLVAVCYSSKTSDDYSYRIQSGNNVKYTLQSLQNSNSNYPVTVSWNYSTTKANSISARVGLCLKDGNGNLTHFAYSGYGDFQLINRSNKARLHIDATYGHSTINITPDYSITTTGIGLGIKFKAGMDEQHCLGTFYEDFTINRADIMYGVIYGKNNTGGAPANS